MNQHRAVHAGIAGLLLAGAALTAVAADARLVPLATLSGSAPENPAITNVGPVTGVITALNYEPDGVTVNGLYLGATDTLLTFDRPVCGGVGSLGRIGDTVTFSGVELSFASGFNTVVVRNYRDGSTVFSQATSAASKPAPATFAQSTGQVTALNYNPADGSIDGFFFAPAGGAPAVFVNLAHVDSTVAALLEGAAPVVVAVTGVQLPSRTCGQAAPIGVVVASSLTLGGTAYLVGGPAAVQGGGRQ